jgi:hypothetical protein
VRSLPRRCPAAYPGRPARFRRRQRRTAVPAAPKRAATAPGSACRLLQSADAAKLYRQAKPRCRHLEAALVRSPRPLPRRH